MFEKLADHVNLVLDTAEGADVLRDLATEVLMFHARDIERVTSGRPASVKVTSAFLTSTLCGHLPTAKANCVLRQAA
jgi:hypothetical protein